MLEGQIHGRLEYIKEKIETYWQVLYPTLKKIGLSISRAALNASSPQEYLRHYQYIAPQY